MNLRFSKVKDLVKKTDDFNVIFGSNGSGKTRKLKNRYNDNISDKKQIISDTYPIVTKLFCKILIEQDILDGLYWKTLKSKEISNVNTLLGKKYRSIEYTVYSIREMIEDIFGNDEDKYSEIFGNLLDKDTMEAKESYYYYFKVVTENGKNYDTLDMGVGESQLLSFYCSFIERSNTHFYIDEPFNYISVVSAENFVKLLVLSAASKSNVFTFTTNSLEIVDYLIHYNCRVNYLTVFEESELQKISRDQYYLLFRDRYSFFSRLTKAIYVEDDLAAIVIRKFFPDFSVVSLKGSGDLINVAKGIRIMNDNVPFKKLNQLFVIFDGDEEESKAKEFTINERVQFLPFESVEKELGKIILMKEGFYINKVFIESVERQILKDIIKSNENHEAFRKVKSSLGVTDGVLVDFVIKYHVEALSEMKKGIDDICNENE